MIYWDLFLGFLKVGCFSFGGGYGAVALVRDVVLSYGWLDEEMISYMIAVSESTPGPIMVNMATYVGSTQAGFLGALAATTAVVLPSFLIILLVTVLLKTAIKNKYVQAVLQGLTPCVTGIVLATGIHMLLRDCVTVSRGPSYRAIFIALLLYGVKFGYRKVFKKKLSTIPIILTAALSGMILYGI